MLLLKEFVELLFILVLLALLAAALLLEFGPVLSFETIVSAEVSKPPIDPPPPRLRILPIQ